MLVFIYFILFSFIFLFFADGNPVLASASTEGHIALWDLEKRQLGSTLRDAHNGCVSGMKFLATQPLLVTNGPDNSLKVIILLLNQLQGFYFISTSLS